MNLDQSLNINKMEKKLVLPDSFKMEIIKEFGSSGGDRKYKATLVFVDGKLTEGEVLLETSEGTGRIRERVSAEIVNGEWGNKEGGDIESWSVFSNYNFLTKEGLQNYIDSGEILQSDKQIHLKTTFRIVK